LQTAVGYPWVKAFIHVQSYLSCTGLTNTSEYAVPLICILGSLIAKFIEELTEPIWEFIEVNKLEMALSKSVFVKPPEVPLVELAILFWLFSKDCFNWDKAVVVSLSFEYRIMAKPMMAHIKRNWTNSNTRQYLGKGVLIKGEVGLLFNSFCVIYTSLIVCKVLKFASKELMCVGNISCISFIIILSLTKSLNIFRKNRWYN